MTFQEKVQSMTAKEIIMAMVDSLIIPPLIKISMGTFGDVREQYNIDGLSKVVCVGCAATNTICKISGKLFDSSNIYSRFRRANSLLVDQEFLRSFESAIDFLRVGNIHMYNSFAVDKFAKIRWIDIHLPILSNNYTNEMLEPYKRLAEAQL